MQSSADLGMPLMDGLQVAAALRKESHLQDAFLIALTGWGSAADRRRSRRRDLMPIYPSPPSWRTLERY